MALYAGTGGDPEKARTIFADLSNVQMAEMCRFHKTQGAKAFVEATLKKAGFDV